MRSQPYILLLGAAVAALSAALAAAGGAAAQTKASAPAGPVDVKLQRQIQHLAASGFERIGGETVAAASRDEPSVFPVELSVGATYAVVAACDEGCSHVEIALFDPAQSLLTRSPERSDVVIVGGPVQQGGVHGIALSVPGCPQAACAAGFVLLRQAAPAPAPEPPQISAAPPMPPLPPSGSPSGPAAPGAEGQSLQALMELAKMAVTAREAARAREQSASPAVAPIVTDVQSAPGRPPPSKPADRERPPRASSQGNASQAACQQVAQQYAAAVQTAGPPGTMPDLFRLYQYLQCNCGYPPSPQVPPCPR